MESIYFDSVAQLISFPRPNFVLDSTDCPVSPAAYYSNHAHRSSLAVK